MLCIHSLIYPSQPPWGGIIIPVSSTEKVGSGWEAQRVKQPPSAWWPLSHRLYLLRKNPRKATFSQRRMGPLGWNEGAGLERVSAWPAADWAMSVPRASWWTATCLNPGFKYCWAFLRGKVPCSPEGVSQRMAVAEIGVSLRVPGSSRWRLPSSSSSSVTLIQAECFPCARRCSSV